MQNRHFVIFISVLLLIINSCSKSSKSLSEPNRYAGDSTNIFFKRKIDRVDSLFESHKDVIVLVKTTESDTLKEVKDLNNWPNNIEIIYNICKDKVNRVTLLKEIPSIESDDYSLIYNYYFFNEATFAIILNASFFNERCSDSALEEDHIYYYSDDFKIIKQLRTLKDVNGKVLNKNGCGFGELENVKFYSNFSQTPLSDILRR